MEEILSGEKHSFDLEYGDTPSEMISAHTLWYLHISKHVYCYVCSLWLSYYDSIFVSHSHSTPLLEMFLADCINLNEVGFKMTSGWEILSLAV